MSAGRYAALWPVLGIVGQLLLLAAIIYLCESRKGKTALDDIDLDIGDDRSVVVVGSRSAPCLFCDT